MFFKMHINILALVQNKTAMMQYIGTSVEQNSKNLQNSKLVQNKTVMMQTAKLVQNKTAKFYRTAKLVQNKTAKDRKSVV